MGIYQIHAIARVLSILALIFVGFGVTASNAAEPKSGGTLVMLVKPELPTLASYLSTSGPIGQISTKIYEGLLEYDFDLNPQPSLAEAWNVSGDGKTVTFNLRKGVTFHDGTAFTSADVQYSVMEVLKKAHPRVGNTFKEMVSVGTPDEHTAIFNLANPAPYMIRALSVMSPPSSRKSILRVPMFAKIQLQMPRLEPAPSNSWNGKKGNIFG